MWHLNICSHFKPSCQLNHSHLAKLDFNHDMSTLIIDWCRVALKHVGLSCENEVVVGNRLATVHCILLSLPYGKRLMGSLWNGPKFWLPTITGHQTHGISNSLFKWSLVASDCWCKMVPKMIQRVVLVGQPIGVGNVCKIILGQRTLTTSCLVSIVP